MLIRIGELARRTGSPVETIRYYERAGLLPGPARSEGNYRLYGPAHEERLRFIRHCRSLDMSLDEVRAMLELRDAPGANCAAAGALLDRHIGHVAARIAGLQALQAQLGELRSRCTGEEAASCELLAPLDAEPANLGSHRGGCH